MPRRGPLLRGLSLLSSSGLGPRSPDPLSSGSVRPQGGPKASRSAQATRPTRPTRGRGQAENTRTGPWDRFSVGEMRGNTWPRALPPGIRGGPWPKANSPRGQRGTRRLWPPCRPASESTALSQERDLILLPKRPKAPFMLERAKRFRATFVSLKRIRGLRERAAPGRQLGRHRCLCQTGVATIPKLPHPAACGARAAARLGTPTAHTGQPPAPARKVPRSPTPFQPQ